MKIYIRIAKTTMGKYRVVAGSKPNNTPIKRNSYDGGFLPTVFFAIDVNVPESQFSLAEQVVAKLNLPEVESKAEVELLEDNN